MIQHFDFHSFGAFLREKLTPTFVNDNTSSLLRAAYFRRGTAASGTAMRTTSCARAVCSTVAAVAPVSAATVADDAGPPELAITTWCPSAVRCRARVLPMLPEPMIPMSMLYFHFCGAIN